MPRLKAPALSDRFQREALAASSLNHPHICARRHGETNGRPFLVMELVEGQTLHDFLLAGPMDAATAIQMGIQSQKRWRLRTPKA